MATTREEALNMLRSWRNQIDAILEDANDSSEIVNIISQATDAIREWDYGAYSIGDVRMYNGIPRKCVTAHDSTGSPSWTPDVTSLWMQYHGTSPETAREYVAPTGGHDVYHLGEYMIWQGSLYTPAIDNLAYSPSEYAQGWTIVNA